jgi:hypothetical protein
MPAVRLMDSQMYAASTENKMDRLFLRFTTSM